MMLQSKTGKSSSSKMEHATLVSGVETTDMAEVCKFGQMARAMKVIGVLIRLMDREHSGTCTAINMKVNGSMIKRTVTGLTRMLMAQSTRATGKTTSSTDSVLKSGPMDLSMTANM